MLKETYEGDIEELIENDESLWHMNDYLYNLSGNDFIGIKRLFSYPYKTRDFEPFDLYVYVDEEEIPHSFSYEHDFRQWLCLHGY